MLYICNQKQLKVQYIGICEEILFLLTKNALLKRGPKIRAMPKRKRFFSIDPFPKGLAPFSYTVHGQVHEQSKHIYDRDNQKSDRKGAKIAINCKILVKNVI